MSSSLFFVSATLIGLTFETGHIERHGITSYVVAPQDRVNDRLLLRSGEPVGFLIGRDRQHLAPFYQFKKTELSDFAGDGGTWHHKRTAAVDRATSYRVLVNGQRTSRLSGLSRKIKILESGRTAPEIISTVKQITIFLMLAEPLQIGAQVTVTFGDPGSEITTHAVYEPNRARSPAVHISQIGFEPEDRRKYGYYSVWLGHPGLPSPTGDLSGRYELRTNTKFSVIDDVTNQSVFEGTLQPAQDGSGRDFDKTQVYRADFSQLRRQGTYRLSVEGAGTSYPFIIKYGIWKDAFWVAARGFYHQRSGIALQKPFTDWTRPRSLHPDDGFVAYQSGATLMDTDQGLNLRKRTSFKALVDEATDQVIPEAWGGWHDAGDWDRRIQHLFSVRSLLLLSDLKPDFVHRLDLNIPDTIPGLPDLVQEALWGLDVFKRLQKSDGGVPGGIEGSAYARFGEASWTDPQQLYVYAPDPWSSYHYAATAARASLVVALYDRALARLYLDSAERAFRWAERNGTAQLKGERALVDSRNLAAAELFRVTNQTSYAKIFRETSSFVAEQPAKARSQHEAGFTFLQSQARPEDTEIRSAIKMAILWYADLYLKEGRGTFDQIRDPWRPYLWGNVSNLPEAAAEVLLPAHVLTGEQRYFDPLISSTFFGLGANPDNMVYTTGLGRVNPAEVLHLDRLALGPVPPPPGITIFGTREVEPAYASWWLPLVNAELAPFRLDQMPTHESYQGYVMAPEITEYTVTNGLREPALIWGYLAACSTLIDQRTPPSVTRSGIGSRSC